MDGTIIRSNIDSWIDKTIEWVKAHVDAQRRQELWTIARENLQAARHAVQQQWYNVSASRSYYAAYTAMWVAVDDPPRTRWQHAGIVKVFAQGYWQSNQMSLPRDMRKALETLYKHRLKADYHGRPVTVDEAQEAMTTAEQVLILVATELDLPRNERQL
jgi:uncharacterized protein (UPF0332 family)